MNAKNSNLLYKQLVEKLSNSQLDKNLLIESSKFIAKVHGRGITWEDVFPLGTPKPDTIVVKGKATFNSIGRLKGLLNSKDLTRIEIFPRGIIDPRHLEIDVSFSKNLHRQK